ncbi:leucine-rich repeat extensin-like protein 5 [Juglans microcarpa x Juglans regia]|uniref:leucine-rich repeat extensin-like protein 5 n=1 Tax=Juglans microcarpa x Juglans regia TaxID=2249226 RepID=UPI001B7F6C57|nr:leucine-rich repeat extensin-like protein 5 [Juglans microcarpa x Juglans regia]
MGEEEDGRPPRPSTSISLTQGYYGTINPYNLPYMMPPNPYPYPYPHPNPYAWGSQHLVLPPFGPTMPSPLLSNLEELRRGEDTTKQSVMPPCVPTMPYPHSASESSTMPSNSVAEKNFGETYPHPYSYAWGSQHLAPPPFGPTMPSPLSSNPEELRRDEDTTKH